MPHGSMTFYAFGLNHESASVQATEAFALNDAARQRLYQSIALQDDAELILLSTCNRTEAYLYGEPRDVGRVQQALAAHAGQSWPAAKAFMLADEPAVRHVLELTSGLRSLVLGDAQILAQMKDAYRGAVEADTVDTLLHRLMHTAFRAAKRVANETALASGAASVSSAAVAMARDHFRDLTGEGLDGRRVLLIGAGKMGRLALTAMRSYAPSSITVTNRSAERADEVASAHDAHTAPWQERHEFAAESDVVIVATGAPDPVLTPERMPSVTGDMSTLLIDISMPRNIDPRIDQLAGYTVYDLDALRSWTNRVEAQRGAEVPEAKAICDELMNDFVTWVFHQQALQPAIQAIRGTFDAIRTQEIDRHHQRFSKVDREELDQLTRSIMQKLLAIPIVRLKNVEPDSIDFVRGIELLRVLFERPDECTEAESTPRSSTTSRRGEQPRLSDIPPQCPFGEMPASTKPEDEPAYDELLRRVLTEAMHDERANGTTSDTVPGDDA
jgi:glutamyl-tRNA reductase